jgi:hypothetical protein
VHTVEVHQESVDLALVDSTIVEDANTAKLRRNTLGGVKLGGVVKRVNGKSDAIPASPEESHGAAKVREIAR